MNYLYNLFKLILFIMEDDSTKTKINFINKVFKQYDKKLITYQLCEECLDSGNLIICEVCKNYYHLKVF